WGMDGRGGGLRPAGVVLLVMPAGTPGAVREECRRGLPAALTLDVASKADLVTPAPEEGLAVSVRTATGVDLLRERVLALLRGTGADVAGAAGVGRHPPGPGPGAPAAPAAGAAPGPPAGPAAPPPPPHAP